MSVRGLILASLLILATLVLGIGAACSGSTATSPTPTPPPTPPPVAAAPTLACPNPVSASSTATTGIAVSYDTPTAEGGQSPVTVTCTPESGTMFGIGQASGECCNTGGIGGGLDCLANANALIF